MPPQAVQLVTTRSEIDDLLALDDLIDLVIPRGGNELVRYIKTHTKIPVLGHADGICSIFLDETADVELATRVLIDAKTGYPAVCNSVETLLVSRAALSGVFLAVATALLDKGVELRCDEESTVVLAPGLVGRYPTQIKEATPADYTTEFLTLILAVKTVDGLDAAIAHINAHGSHHTDAILTATADDAERFMRAVDSAGVFWNASTRMADGLRYGFGTEVGVSTNKIHARGPVGLEGLMIYKFKLRGHGQGSLDYGDGEGKRKFLHQQLEL